MSRYVRFPEKEFIGMKFNHVTVLSRNNDKKSKPPYYNCICDCGRIFVRRKDCIYNPLNKTCGYCQREKHNSTHTRLYSIYKNMVYRCTKKYAKHYENYGGRGIKVCDEWINSFQKFKDWSLSHGYQDNLTIDRINTNGNYEPSNCRWVTRMEQSHNLRNNHLVYYKGERKPLSQWCRELNIKISSVRKRLIYTNDDLEKALNLPDDYHINHKKLNMISLDNKILKTFNSPTECANYLKTHTNFKANCGRIIDVCIGRRNKAYGYKFEYVDNEGGD